MNCFLLLDVLDPHGPTCVRKMPWTPGRISSEVTCDLTAGGDAAGTSSLVSSGSGQTIGCTTKLVAMLADGLPAWTPKHWHSPAASLPPLDP